MLHAVEMVPLVHTGEGGLADREAWLNSMDVFLDEIGENRKMKKMEKTTWIP